MNELLKLEQAHLNSLNEIKNQNKEIVGRLRQLEALVTQLLEAIKKRDE